MRGEGPTIRHVWSLRLAIIAGLALPVACDPEATDGRAPAIEAVRPAAARAGVEVTLVGRNFGLPGARDRVWLGGVEVEVRRWADRAIDLVVPADNGPGVFDFVVRTDARISAPYAFEVLDSVGLVAP